MIKINLDKNERFILYNEEMDISIIEIKIDDNINDKCFLLPNLDNYMEYIDKDIYIVQYPLGKNISYSEGKIKNIKNEELIYDASTKLGSSGSPILLKNTIEVIGIHKQGNIYENENYGTLVYSFIETLEIPNKLINQKKFYENGSYFYGQMINDLEHGKGKVYDMNDRLIYDGDFVEGKFEGNGIYLLEDDGHYIGQFLDGLEHGKGIIYDNKGNVRYEGDFVKGKYHGDGKYNFEEGGFYIGQWENVIKLMVKGKNMIKIIILFMRVIILMANLMEMEKKFIMMDIMLANFITE